MKIFSHKLFYITILFLFCCNSMFSQQAQTTTEQESEQMLTSRYNLTTEQLNKFETLKEQRRQRITNANKSTKSAKERNAIIAGIKSDFQTQVGTILNEQQYQTWVQDVQHIASLRKEVNEVFDNYWYKQIRSGLDLNNLDYADACRAKIKTLIGEKEGEKQFNTMLKYQFTSLGVFQHLKLPHNVAIKFAQAKLWHFNTTRQIRRDMQPSKSRDTKLADINMQYVAKAKKILGPQKFVVWKQYLSQEFERKATKRYGFSSEQIIAYKEIHNKMAIDILATKQARNSATEKQNRITQIKSQKDEKIKSLLTPEQYQKWSNDQKPTIQQ